MSPKDKKPALEKTVFDGDDTDATTYIFCSIGSYSTLCSAADGSFLAGFRIAPE